MCDTPTALRKCPALADLRKFQSTQVALGNATRQEAVSMIPPVLLDVQPHHTVLDMCASPGSKTTQIVEFLNAAGPPGPGAGGFVVANDVNPKRAFTLLGRFKAIPTERLVATAHDARHFPAPTPPSKTTGGMFDRVLCDVPCSGDGTLRKTRDWRSWSVHNGVNLHAMQLAIALRGYQVLKTGGTMVYSTCTMNPIENEAVVAELLRLLPGAIELVDCSDKLHGLLRRPGLSKWVVFDKDGTKLDTVDSNVDTRSAVRRVLLFVVRCALYSAAC